jgi:hypothetical protein
VIKQLRTNEPKVKVVGEGLIGNVVDYLMKVYKNENHDAHRGDHVTNAIKVYFFPKEFGTTHVVDQGSQTRAHAYDAP